jgi:hypothetical protein
MPSPPQRNLSVLDALMTIRSDLKRGRLGIYIGEPNVDRMVGFVEGLYFAQAWMGNEDAKYDQFKEWLVEVKRAWPAEGWGPAYLAKCGGDHERAIETFLDYVAEYLEQRQAPG